MSVKIDGNQIMLPPLIEYDPVNNNNDDKYLTIINKYEKKHEKSLTKKFTNYEYIMHFWVAFFTFIYDNIKVKYVIDEGTGIKYYDKKSEFDKKEEEHPKNCKNETHYDCEIYEHKYIKSVGNIKYIMKWAHSKKIILPDTVPYAYLYINDFKKIASMIKDFSMDNIIFNTNGNFTIQNATYSDEAIQNLGNLTPSTFCINNFFNYTDLLLDYTESYRLKSKFTLLQIATACYKIKTKKFTQERETFDDYVNIEKDENKNEYFIDMIYYSH
jgi:hypothetical protein